MAIRIFLDTNIFIAYLLERDSFIDRILSVSKKGLIELYTSIHVITEIVNFINRNETPKPIIDRFHGLIAENIIKIIYDYSDKIISGSKTLYTIGISYTDYINLQIAKEKNIEYFVTDDVDLVNRKKYNEMKITNSRKMNELISGDIS